jgi:transposase
MKLRVQEFKKMQNGKAYFYSWIGYSYRNEKGTPTFKRLVSLANLPDKEVEAIKAVLSIEGEVTDHIFNVSFLTALPIGAEFAAFRLAEDLGIIKALECLPEKDAKLITAMILNRVVEPFPMSKKALYENLDGSGLARILELETEDIKLDDMYFALDKLQPCKNNIEKFLFDYRKVNNSRMFLYDITSSYFEGDSCPLEAFGYNRDGKKGKKQIVIGLLTDENGCPISVEVFEGNTADQTTVLGRIDSMRERFGIDEMVFVGDRGMLTKARREDLQSKDYEKVKYISALSRREFEHFLNDDDHPLQLSLFDRQHLVEVQKDAVRYVLSFNPELENESRETRRRLIEKTAEKLEGIKKSVASGRLKDRDKIAKRLYSCYDKWHAGHFFEIVYDEGNFDFHLNEEKVADYAKIDGFYVLTSDVVALSTEEVRTKYKSLQMVEQAFRTMKTTDLFMRPIRHWNAERVKAHVFVCMLSYMVIWQARQVFAEFLEPDDALRVSLRTIWKKLGKVQIGRIKIGNKIHEQLGEISNETREILKKAGASLTGKNLKKVGL